MAMILVSVVLGATGQLALKHGMGGVDRAAGLAPWLLKTFTTPYVLAGLACYAVSVTIWLAVLQRVDLSYAYPLADVSKVVVLVLSVLLFRESPTLMRVVGTLVICIGAALVAWG